MAPITSPQPIRDARHRKGEGEGETSFPPRPGAPAAPARRIPFFTTPKS